MLKSCVVSAVLLGVALLGSQLWADEAIEPVSYHDFANAIGEPYGPFPATWMVVTASNSLALAVVPGGFRQTLHHHDQEQ